MAFTHLSSLQVRGSWFTYFGLFLCFSLSFWGFTVHNDFALGIHHDESKKVDFLLHNKQDFKHPILMLQSIRAALSDFGAEHSEQEVANNGRYVSAFYGALAMAFFYLLLVYLLGNLPALLITLAVASSPMVLLHAHYLKEDIYLLCGLMLTLLGHTLWVKERKWYYFAIYAIGIGLALSAHYKSLTYAVVAVLMLVSIPRKWLGQYLLFSLLAAFLGLGIFALINYPIFDDFQKFQEGFRFEREHALKGHTVKLWPSAWWCTFHLQKSLFPGIGAIAAIIGVLGLVWRLFYWKSLAFGERLLAIFTLVFYFVVELSPLKPHPGYIRYALPVVPGLVFFFYRFWWLLFKHLKVQTHWALIPVLLLLPYEGYMSAKRLQELEPDTRELAEERHEKEPDGSLVYEAYTNDHGKGIFSIGYLNPDTVVGNPYKYFVLSSFVYDRYKLGKNICGQSKELYRIAELYDVLWELPHFEIKKSMGSFGFHNPTIRFIDVRGVELKPIFQKANTRGHERYEDLKSCD